ncbi:MAG TPA: chemotaxis protein CheW [Burkholderiaceae bacterium]|nr:chemotaxis protein CheW [Burkholderiaceae bacterium]
MSRADSRNRLREFQESLAQRLAQAKSTPAAASRLGFAINERRWLMELPEAGEIVPIQDVASVPLTHAWFRGLINIRGNLVTVVDLSAFMGGPPTRLERDSRVLSFSPALEFNAGLLVTRMLGLHNVSRWSVREPNDAPAWVTRGWDDGEAAWDEISLATLATDERFLRISPL